MSLDDVTEARDKQHEHGVDVDFVEEGSRRVDSRQDVDLGSLSDLTLVASVDVPLNVLLKRWPPEAIREHVSSGVDALVS